MSGHVLETPPARQPRSSDHTAVSILRPLIRTSTATHLKWLTAWCAAGPPTTTSVAATRANTPPWSRRGSRGTPRQAQSSMREHTARRCPHRRWRDALAPPGDQRAILSTSAPSSNRNPISVALDSSRNATMGIESRPSIWSKYPERSRERFLTDTEFFRLGRVLDEAVDSGAVPLTVVTAIRLLMLTGSSRSGLPPGLQCPTSSCGHSPKIRPARPPLSRSILRSAAPFSVLVEFLGGTTGRAGSCGCASRQTASSPCPASWPDLGAQGPKCGKQARPCFGQGAPLRTRHAAP